MAEFFVLCSQQRKLFLQHINFTLLGFDFRLDSCITVTGFSCGFLGNIGADS